MPQFQDLVLRSVEHEMGGGEVYAAALEFAVNGDLREEWEKYHRQTKHHLKVLTEVCSQLGIPGSGMKAILPPPEGRKDVKTAIGAARAEQSTPKSL